MGERSRPMFNAILSRFKDIASNRDRPSSGRYDDLRFKLPVLKIGDNATAIGAQVVGDVTNIYVTTDKSGQSLN